jgi:predicted metalloprotease with PDZ domain
LDGYSLGVPNRKSSIYTEGALITFILDVEIRKASKDKRSFDDVMRSFYNDHYLKAKGISESDYQATVERFARKSMNSFFNKYVNAAGSIETLIKSSLKYLGFELIKKERENYHESYLGFVTDENDKVVMIYPDSVAEIAGLSIEDQILSVNGISINKDLSDWCRFFSSEEIVLVVKDKYSSMNELSMKSSKAIYYANYEVKKVDQPTKEQEAAFGSWMKS